MEPTQPPSCSGCPLYGVARGFVLGCGDPTKARYAVVLEAPGKDETVFELKPNPSRRFLSTKETCDAELAIRRRDYPELDDRWLRLGVPVVGQTGGALMWWIWPKVGIRREECFIDNTIRCLPPKIKDKQYPTGATKKEAERCCRQYDRLALFRPDTIVFSLHPASLLREITPLPLVVKDFEKIRDFTQQGRRVLALLGGKATSAFARYGSNVTKWRGHYQALTKDWCVTYRSLFEFAKKKRKKVDKSVNIEGDYFCVPDTIVAKAVRSRPDETAPGLCRAHKRHTHKRPPCCGHSGCWDEYERLSSTRG